MLNTLVVYILFSIGSLFVLSRRPWVSGLGLASAAWFIYFPDAIYHSYASRNENIVLSIIALYTTLLLIFLKRKRIRIEWRNWWVRLVCYMILVMILPWMLLKELSMYNAVLYPTIFLFVFVVTLHVRKWQAIFWAISWLISFNIVTNYVGVPGWPWEAPIMYIENPKNILFNLNIAYDSIWLSLLMGVSFAFSMWRPRRLILLVLFLLYFIVTWIMHWSRSVTFSAGVLLTLIPFIMKRPSKFWARTAIASVISLILVFNYLVIVPWVLKKSFWADPLTQTRVEEKLIRKIITDETRARLFKATFNLWKESPIWGVGFFRSGEIVFGREGEGPHSGLLILLAEGGILAAAMFLLGLRDFFRTTNPLAPSNNEAEKALKSLVFLGIFSLLPRMMGDGVFYNTPIFAIFVITGYRIKELTSSTKSEYDKVIDINPPKSLDNW